MLSHSHYRGFDDTSKVNERGEAKFVPRVDAVTSSELTSLGSIFSFSEPRESSKRVGKHAKRATCDWPFTRFPSRQFDRGNNFNLIDGRAAGEGGEGEVGAARAGLIGLLAIDRLVYLAGLCQSWKHEFSVVNRREEAREREQLGVESWSGG